MDGDNIKMVCLIFGCICWLPALFFFGWWVIGLINGQFLNAFIWHVFLWGLLSGGFGTLNILIGTCLN